MNSIETIANLLKSGRLSCATLADRTGVLLRLDGLEVLSLNETALFLVQAMQEGAASEAALVARLVNAFEVDEATAERDVQTFTHQLATSLRL